MIRIESLIVILLLLTACRKDCHRNQNATERALKGRWEVAEAFLESGHETNSGDQIEFLKCQRALTGDCSGFFYPAAGGKETFDWGLKNNVLNVLMDDTTMILWKYYQCLNAGIMECSKVEMIIGAYPKIILRR